MVFNDKIAAGSLNRKMKSLMITAANNVFYLVAQQFYSSSFLLSTEFTADGLVRLLSLMSNEYRIWFSRSLAATALLAYERRRYDAKILFCYRSSCNFWLK